MAKNNKQIIILLIQIFMFYIFPLSAGPTDTMGMIFLIIVATFILGIIMGYVTKEKYKYLYPFVVSILFIPSIYIYYNESAYIHVIWYFVISLTGLLVGSLIRLLIKKINR